MTVPQGLTRSQNRPGIMRSALCIFGTRGLVTVFWVSVV